MKRRALIVIGIAIALDVLLGIVFALVQNINVGLGIYCALANAVTVGGTVPPSKPLGYLTTGLECALVVPLFAASFSLFTSQLTATHPLSRRRERMLAHIIKHTSEIPTKAASEFDETGAARPLYLAAAVAVGLGVVAVVWWPDVLRGFYNFSGARNPSGVAYGIHSGIGGSLPDVLILGSLFTLLYHRNCHVKGCWRIGKPVAGTAYLGCHRHHPGHDGESRNVPLEVIERAHAEAQKRDGLDAGPPGDALP